MAKIFKILLISALLVFTSFVVCPSVLAQSDSGQATPTLQVTGECNNNGICESNLGETSNICPNECGCNNNNICESQRGEDRSNCFNDCPPSSGVNPPELGLYIKNLEVGKITFDSAEIFWKTNREAICNVYVGKTAEYEKETISETEVSTNHLVKLIDLSFSTTYHFNIICKDLNDLTTQTGDRYFTTLFVISNVNNFIAVAGQQEIFLRWENSSDPDFQLVRIVRSETFYPPSIDDGDILYEGTEEFFTDNNVEILKTYYYSIFAKSKNGSWSSGAVAFAIIQPTPVIPLVVPPVVPPVTPPVIPPEIAKLSLKDFDFYSEGVKLLLVDDKTINVGLNENLIISIAYEKVSSGYKLIAELAIDKNTFSYLFAVSQENTVYSTSLISPELVQKYPLTIKIYNEKNNFVYELEGELSVFKKPEPFGKNIYLIWLITHINIFLFILLLILLLLLFLLLVLLLLDDRKEKDENNRKKKNLKIGK